MRLGNLVAQRFVSHVQAHPESAPYTKGHIMVFLLVRSKVRDFQTWKPAYDAHLPMRTKAGLTEKYLLRSADDPNEIVLLFEAQDLNRAKEFAASADLRDRMQESGVVDKPDIYFLND